MTLSYGVCTPKNKPVQVVYLKDDQHVTETEPSKDNRLREVRRRDDPPLLVLRGGVLVTRSPMEMHKRNGRREHRERPFPFVLVLPMRR